MRLMPELGLGRGFPRPRPLLGFPLGGSFLEGPLSRLAGAGLILSWLLPPPPLGPRLGCFCLNLQQTRH